MHSYRAKLSFFQNQSILTTLEKTQCFLKNIHRKYLLYKNRLSVVNVATKLEEWMPFLSP